MIWYKIPITGRKRNVSDWRCTACQNDIPILFPILQIVTAKLNRYVKQLKQLKDYDKKLMEEKTARAKQEQERERLEVSIE